LQNNLLAQTSVFVGDATRSSVFVGASLQFLSGQTSVFVGANLGFCRGKSAKTIGAISFQASYN
jgi:hypothetical protein